MRVSTKIAAAAQTILLSRHCRVAGELDDSRTAEQRFPHARATPIAFDGELTQAIVMPTTVQFNRELCRRTIEIQYVTVERMLTAKFVAVEISVAQVAPKDPLTISCLLSQESSAIHESLF